MSKEKPLVFIAKLTGKAKLLVLQEKEKSEEQKVIKGKSLITNYLLSELYEIKNKK